MTSPGSIRTSFGNTISWKSFMKNDCVQSSLIELQSFPQSKIDVDPIRCVLMSLPCFMQILCMTWCIQVDRIRILMILVHKNPSQPVSTHILRTELLDVPAHCCSYSSQTCSIHEKFRLKSENFLFIDRIMISTPYLPRK